jgi:integral membrane protein (TIGR01906 family)
MTAARWSAAAEIGVAAVLWAALVAGSAVLALTIPVYASALSRVLAIPQSAGLPAADALKLSDQVRALVADREFDPLPATWAGAPAFDAAAVSHLMDVRRVIGGARFATGIAALLLALYTAFGIARRRFVRLAAGMRAGAVLTGVVLVVALIAAVSDFTWLFTAFHGLFFTAGTWTFPADSLLIRLFPERFWMASGGAWAALAGVGAAVLVTVARFVRGAEARLSASRMANNV